MKNTLSIVSTLVLGAALSMTACGKDKKQATPAPASAEPAATAPAAPAGDPAKPADPAAPKAEDKKAEGGGW